MPEWMRDGNRASGPDTSTFGHQVDEGEQPPRGCRPMLIALAIVWAAVITAAVVVFWPR